MTTPKERREDFIKNGLAPFFKAKGFKKKGNKFLWYGDKLTYVFYPFRGRYNSDEYMDFAFYFSLYTHDFDKKEELSTYILSLLEGNVARISQNKECYYFWITFTLDDSEPEIQDEKIKGVLLKDLEDKILPYIFNLKSIQDIIQLIESTPTKKEQFWNIPTPGIRTIERLALYYWLLEEKRQAIETLDKGLASIDDIVIPQFRAGAIQDLEETKKRILEGPDRYVRKSLDSLV